MTSLVCQILYLLGKAKAIDSTINTNDEFETLLYNTFEENTDKILKNLDNILDENNSENRNENKIIQIYMQTQELIYTTYFSKACKYLTTTKEVDEKVDKLENYDKMLLVSYALRNADGTPLLLDFCFNGWGEKFDARLDNAINKGLFEWLSVERRALSDNCQDNNQTPLNTQHSTLNKKVYDFVLEGGSIESDGQGTIFTTTSCLLAPHRNQPLTKEQIDKRLRQMLGADRIVWLDHGQLIGDDTDGHIDTIVRPCAHDTLLYIRCDNPNDEHYEDFKALEKQLKGLRTAEDKPYKLMPLPFPDPIYYDGERLPATYANFLIINGAVLVPTYRQPENDAKALETLQKAFPDREMVPIDSTIITRQHGSIHCCTMQIPKEMQF